MNLATSKKSKSRDIARETLETFLGYWIKRDFYNMFLLTPNSWKAREPLWKQLETELGYLEVKDVEIVSFQRRDMPDVINKCLVKSARQYRVNFTLTDGRKVTSTNIMVLREKGTRTPVAEEKADDLARWGVNPRSVTRNILGLGEKPDIGRAKTQFKSNKPKPEHIHKGVSIL